MYIFIYFDVQTCYRSLRHSVLFAPVMFMFLASFNLLDLPELGDVHSSSLAIMLLS